ncbi:hypothetical protein N7454_001997 [Penicillium verhagenii]|nr:hypothetical protein N7454_001997 [Penicillium verhagenii]
MPRPHTGLFARRSWTCIQCRAHSSTAGAQVRKGKTNLPDAPARTRFAPSPTGYLHLGSLRTALFNYLLAKRTGGQFLLRIEDTDQKRTIPGAEQRLYDDLRWAGLHWDEGPVVGGPFGPYRQVEGYPMFNDLVYGKTGQNKPNNNKMDFIDRVYDDPILIKSDGHPTYHLANVVDDHCMEITHVIRGTEWMPSTPMHMALYNAFKWTPPRFGHVPLLVDKSGQKLSKRNADIDLSSFKDQQGIFPATLVNFAALLGWSHLQKSDIFDLGELEQIFNLKITRGNTIVAFEKLWFLQKAHAQRFAANGGPEFDKMVNRVCDDVKETHSQENLAPLLKGRSLAEYVAPLLRADAKSYTTAPEFKERNSTFFTTKLDRVPYVPTSTSKIPSPPQVPMQALHTAAAALTLVPTSHWTIETHRFNVNSYDGSDAVTLSSETTGSTDKIFKKELYHYLRWALSASAPGPGIPETMTILGREETVRRIQDAKALTQDLVPAVGRRVPKGNQSMGDDRSWMGSLAGGQ